MATSTPWPGTIPIHQNSLQMQTVSSSWTETRSKAVKGRLRKLVMGGKVEGGTIRLLKEGAIIDYGLSTY